MIYDYVINRFRLTKGFFVLIDTHCHMNIMVKDFDDKLLHIDDKHKAQEIVKNAQDHNVSIIINVGTSLIESRNCIMLAEWFANNYAVIGIHPNDCTSSWQQDIRELEILLQQKKELKIVGIGECGLDFHYPDYNISRQKDAFRAQIELSLEHDLALVVHTRDARDETLRVLEEYKDNLQRTVIHCFSEDLAFAQTVTAWNCSIGLGGTITYPKNNYLREIAQTINFDHIVLETDAPFLPPQSMRGKKNSPSSIALIAQYLAELRSITFEEVASRTTVNAKKVFGID
jgi:TatD DNase family protein